MKKPGQGRYTALYLMSLPSTRHELHLLPQSCTNPLGSSSPTDEKPNEPLGWRAMGGKNVQTSGYFISSIENSVGAAKVINCRRKLVVQNMVDFGSHYICRHCSAIFAWKSTYLASSFDRWVRTSPKSWEDPKCHDTTPSCGLTSAIMKTWNLINHYTAPTILQTIPNLKPPLKKNTSHITWSFLNKTHTHTNQSFLQLILTPISPKSRALVRTSIPNPPAWRAKWLQGNHPNLPIPLHTLPHKEGYQETN